MKVKGKPKVLSVQQDKNNKSRFSRLEGSQRLFEEYEIDGISTMFEYTAKMLT